MKKVLLVSLFALLAMAAVTTTACRSDESEEKDVYYTAEVLYFESSQNYGKAEIIHSAKDDKLSERLVENAQFIFYVTDEKVYDITDGDIITFKARRLIVPDYPHIFVLELSGIEIEIIKIERK